MDYSFTELDRAVIHVISLVSFLCLWFSFCLSSDGRELKACGSFLMGGIGCGENLCFALGGRAFSVNS